MLTNYALVENNIAHFQVKSNRIKPIDKNLCIWPGGHPKATAVAEGVISMV